MSNLNINSMWVKLVKKSNVELKRQRPGKFPLHLKEKPKKLLTQLKDTDIIREMGDDDEMGSLYLNRSS